MAKKTRKKFKKILGRLSNPATARDLSEVETSMVHINVLLTDIAATLRLMLEELRNEP